MTESSSTPQNNTDANNLPHPFMRWLGGRSKTSLALSAGVCFAIFWFLGYITDLPVDRGFNASLLAQPSPLFALFITAIGLLACTLLMSVIQFHGEAEDPLMAIGIGLIALSCRGGTMTDLLQMSSSLNVFWWLILELILLYAMLAGCGLLLQRIRNQREKAALISEPSEWSERLLCTLVTALVMGVCLYLIAQTDEKKQVFAAVGISAFAGAAAAYAFFDIHNAACYAGGPLAVGIFGYLTGCFIPGPWQTGRIGQPLAYALPLDYAGLGIAGSLLGYWSAMLWKEEGQG
jgi:hypothetical protein